jgi:hypothetical protein
MRERRHISTRFEPPTTGRGYLFERVVTTPSTRVADRAERALTPFATGR